VGQSAVEDPAGAVFLLLPVGARAAATGQAAVAQSGTSEAVFWNPAGLAEIEETEVALHHYEIFVGNGNALGVLVPTGRLGVVGFMLYQLDFGDIDITGPGGGEPLGRISPRNLVFIGSYANRLPADILVGANVKVVQIRSDCNGNCAGIPDEQGTTTAFDFGVQRSVGPFTFGASLQNVGPNLKVQDQADPLPTRLKFGVAYGMVLNRLPGSDRTIDVTFLADVDNDWRDFDGQRDASVGLDVGLGELLRVRAGYRFPCVGCSEADRREAAAGGVGLGVGFRASRVAVDFARTIFTDNELDIQEPTQLSFRLLF
jgi:hypothetical protein